ncbi:MAG: hypothetical protein GWP14_04560 [Actinobacteria bacterium]|nr:hypothetical protein [Actinomycetota bacterium]
MKWLVALITAVLQALLPWIAKKSRPTAEDANPDRDTRDKLRRRVRQHWLIVIPLLLTLLICGCGTRTIYVPDGTPVRLREALKDVKVWVKDANGEPVAGKMDLPEGWYALPLPEDE